MMTARTLAVAAWLALVAGSAGAIGVDTPLPDPAQEARAIAIHKNLRCLVCQNQSILDSNADLARDMRRIVRERIAAGADDTAVVDYLVARYGDWVLLKPPLKATTVALWTGPFVILALAIGAAFAYFRRTGSAPASAPPLSSDEQKRLQELLSHET